MGTTLENGVYLPNEGERNCYAGLKTNWEILDQKVADVTALQQAVAGALHREIVESLPTTDIDPNTIYMILSGTSATENVYNEFMYVNNAWELIGTSATDLTNYYTKAEVDGKLLLKASASDLTSHTGDTTIHVTTADKTKWNNGVSQAYVFRYSSTALVASSTNSNALLDNTDNLKVGDKVIDSDGVLFSITAIDSVNSTFTIGSALVDLAKDSDVVHTSGNETITGTKTFTDNISLKSLTAEYTVTGASISVTYSDKNGLLLAQNKLGNYQSGIAYNKLSIFAYDSNNQLIERTLTYSSQSNTFATAFFRPDNDNIVSLGTTGKRWSGVYSTSYYYGNDNVEFSTKFVTTDTAQKISATKIFSTTFYIYNDDSTGNTPNLYFKSSKAIKGDSSGSNNDSTRISHIDKNDKLLSYIQLRKVSNGSSDITFYCSTTDTNNQDISSSMTFFKAVNGQGTFRSVVDNDVNLGNSTYKWKDVNTYLVNGLTPSSLSLPTDNIANIIDISGYLTVLDGSQANTYQAPDNGYIGITMSNCTGIQAYITGFWGNQIVRPTAGAIIFFMPICKNMTANILVFGGTVDNARFFPCQGNI